MVSWWSDFGEALAATGDVRRSADICGVSRRVVYYHRQRSADFRSLMDAALARRAEAEAADRQAAVAGLRRRN